VDLPTNRQKQSKDSQNSKNDHWYSLDRPVTIGTPMVIFAVLTVFWLFLTVLAIGRYTVGIVNSKQQKRPLVYQSSQVYRDCTNSELIVKNSKKQSQDSQNSKNGHRCTNRHRSTKTVPTVYQSSKTVKNSQTANKWRLVYYTNRHMSTQSPPNTQSPRPRPPNTLSPMW